MQRRREWDFPAWLRQTQVSCSNRNIFQTSQAMRCWITFPPTPAPVPGCVFSVTNCNPRPISFPWELIGFAMVAPFHRGIVSDGAAISLTPTDRYDNVHWLYCQVTEGQHSTHTHTHTHTHTICVHHRICTVPLCSFSSLLVWRGPQCSLNASGHRLCLLVFKYFNNTFLL